jgi:hypothetical protein
MAATTLSTAARNAAADARVALFPAGKLRIYDGTRPAGGGAATTLLAEFTLSSPAAPAASGGAVTFTNPANVNGSASGTATWARITTSGGTYVMDCDVTGTAGAGPVKLNGDGAGNATITSGQPVQCTSFTITEGNA